MEKFFYPQSIAIFGISDSPGNLALYVLENLDRFGFTGRIYAIGRTEKEINGRRVYTRLEDVPEVPDLAVLVIPAPAMPDVLESCGRKGMRHAVIEAAGFSELADERKALEHEIMRITRDAGITCLGPNCVGVINKENGLCTPFIPFTHDEMREGGNSFITQSGGLLHDIIHRCAADNLGLDKLVSIGNKLMIDENDVLEYLIHDRGTHAIAVYLEDISNGRRLMELASRTTKPIMMLKGNASPASREIASFHTAALAGDAAVAAAAFKQAGIHHVENIQDAVDCFKIFDLPLLKGPNLAIIGRSGGQGVLLADQAHHLGFALPKLPSSFFDEIGKHTKAGVIRSTNPVDLGDVWDDLFYVEAVEMALKVKEIDGVVFYFEYGINHDVTFEILKGVEKACCSCQKPVAFCIVPDRSVWFSLRYSRPFPFFTESDRAFSALRRSLDHFRRTEREVSKRSVFQISEREKMTEDVPRILPVSETLSLMEEYGIPVVPYGLAGNRAEAIEASGRIGYPVVLKRAEPPVVHKTEAGAVHLNIKNNIELERATKAMAGDLYLIQEMARDGIDTIVGGKRDPEFGPVVIFGLGGIFVEVLKDVTIRVAPISERDAREMIDEIKGAPLLKGARGKAVADTESLARAIAAVSRLLVDQPGIQTIDINPLRVFEEGKGCSALDVKMEYVGPYPQNGTRIPAKGT
ncbi:MAG: succinyl-CoA synthetase subunit alpha [Syntrophorhabdus sp. PtaU1.Bin002]|nr:MAG: succinyl-CoA synthetase subunit alpha [Syntrophorhabdus sp. PtaB.Bin006]OPY66273.1 MAG: succinyl-CoA synthetase subunit alpha [Syntrophorhabdus sp. PtaU1.Bin002]